VPGVARKGLLDPATRDQRAVKLCGLMAPPVAEPKAGADSAAQFDVPSVSELVVVAERHGSPSRRDDLAIAKTYRSPTLVHPTVQVSR